jgi:hypothetical protein
MSPCSVFCSLQAEEHTSCCMLACAHWCVRDLLPAAHSTPCTCAVLLYGTMGCSSASELCICSLCCGCDWTRCSPATCHLVSVRAPVPSVRGCRWIQQPAVRHSTRRHETLWQTGESNAAESWMCKPDLYTTRSSCWSGTHRSKWSYDYHDMWQLLTAVG